MNREQAEKSEYITIKHYADHVIGEITRRDIEQVSERLHALGWEEVVRCQDCKYFREEPPDEYGFCCYWVDRVIYHATDGFCAWGERRENGYS